MKEFHKYALSQISIWVWAAVILPLVTLAGLFFLEVVGLRIHYHISLMIGAAVMFTLSVIWWWWTVYTIANVTYTLRKSSEKIDEIVVEVAEIKKDIVELKK